MDITAVARLAKLELTAEETEKLGTQLEDVLKQFEALSALPSSPETEQGTQPSIPSKLRPDVAQEVSIEEKNALLACSPHKQENFIKLPAVLENFFLRMSG